MYNIIVHTGEKPIDDPNTQVYIYLFGEDRETGTRICSVLIQSFEISLKDV